MDFEELEGLYQSSDAWRLLRKQRAPVIIAFLLQAFKAEETPAIDAIDAEGLLVDHLLFYSSEEDEDAEEDVDVSSKARTKIDLWVREGWMRRYPNENGSDMLELTAESEKALAFVAGLQEREFVGTESRLQDIFRKLKELVSGSQEDPKKKVGELKAQIKQLKRQIQDIQRTGRVDAFNDTQIKERFYEVNRAARELLSDFREVEKVFKNIVRDIYDRQASAVYRRGDLLGFALDRIEELQDNDQGRSFYAFWEYLINDQKQKELTDMVREVYLLLEEREIPITDHLLRNIRQFLFRNGQKVFTSNQLLAEKLNRIVAEQNLRERKRALALIDAIRKAAQERRDDPPPSANFWEVNENIQVNFPLERPLGQPPLKQVVPPKPKPATTDLQEADLVGLVNPFFVDQARLRANIRSLLREKAQVSLQEVLAAHPPSKGLAEIMAYFSIATSSPRNYVHPENRIRMKLPGTPDRELELPDVIFSK